MSGPLPTISFDSGSTDSPNDRRGHSPRFRAPIVILVAAMIPATAYLVTAKPLVHAQQPGQEQANAPATAVGPFIGEIEQVLKRLNDRIAPLAAPALAEADAIDALKDQAVMQRVAIEKAKMQYQNAKLEREIAEIAITEYELGIAVQDLATIEGELNLARSDLENSRIRTAETKDRLVKVSKASTGSARDLGAVYFYIDRVKADELIEQKAKLVIEQATSKKKVFVEFTRPQRLKEIRADIEKKHSVELSEQANWDLEKSKLQKLERAIKEDKLTDDEKQLLALIDQAMDLEETVRARLDQLAKGGKADPSLQKEIQDLTSQLQDVVNRAEIVQSAAQFAMMKPRIHRAAQRHPVARPN
jgi:hypothetical protein